MKIRSDQAPDLEGRDQMDCSEGCPTAAVMFGVPRVRVLTAERDPLGLNLTVETDQELEGCRRCGVVAVPHDRREHVLHDAPFGRRRVRVRWRKRVRRCPDLACPVVTFSESHPLAAPREMRPAKRWCGPRTPWLTTTPMSSRGQAACRSPVPAQRSRRRSVSTARVAARPARRRTRGVHRAPLPGGGQRLGQPGPVRQVRQQARPAYDVTPCPSPSL